jgi:AbrB family looped-hinge helix DNA binding protein
MESTTVTISPQGQISIPARIRELLDLKPKDILTININPSNQSLTLARQKTLREQLAELDALRLATETPESRAAYERNRGKTANELRAEWGNSPEGQKHYQEKYFNAK